jgi:hypothetical protein
MLLVVYLFVGVNGVTIILFFLLLELELIPKKVTLSLVLLGLLLMMYNCLL